MNDEAGIAVPLASPVPARWRTLFVPVIAILAMIVALGGGFGVVATNSANIARDHRQTSEDVARSCDLNLKFYNTFEKVIYAAGHPPLLAGKKPDPVQAAALAAYAENLRSGLPTKPVC